MFKVTNNRQNTVYVGALQLAPGQIIIVPTLPVEMDDAIASGAVSVHEFFRHDRKCLGHQQFAAASIDAAQALTVPTGATRCRIKPSAQAIRVREDGTNPTTSVGYPIAVGVEYEITGDLSLVRVIGQAANAVLDVVYYGPEQ